MLTVVPTLALLLAATLPNAAHSMTSVSVRADSTPAVAATAAAGDTSTVKLDMELVKKMAATAVAFDSAAKASPFKPLASSGNPQVDMAAAIESNAPVAAVVKNGGFTSAAYAKAYFTLFSAWGMLDAQRQLEGKVPDINQVRLPGVTDENFAFVKAHEQEFVKLGLKAPHATINQNPA